MALLITIQHTESEHHDNGMVGSWTDWDLSEKGIEQAQILALNLAPKLSNQKIKIISSDFKRAVQTAEPLAQYLNVEIKLDGRLRERNLGKAVGKSVDWLRKNKEADEVSAYDKIFADAESRYDVWCRLNDFIKTLNFDTNDTIILVSHGDTLSILYMILFGIDIATYPNYSFSGKVGSISVFNITPTSRKFIALNDLWYTTHFHK